LDIAHILRDVLIVLVAAKIAAEVAERLGVPPVLGEILAGVLIGPSVLGAVSGTDEVLRTLGELGVILLLFDVGLEMDIGELRKVGRASLTVATIGVVTPLVLGLGAMQLVDGDFNTSLFVAAALTATSVGITARVFGDLRALATSEARIVLGAAVADDVMGLVVLTVVVRLVTQGSVSFLSVLGIVAVAVGFLVVGGFVGLRLAPPLFDFIDKFSRSSGTLVALALAFVLGFAELADLAKLAPIVGAFVAGLAISRTRQRERIRRELTPVGHLFIPVFFLQIGIDTQIQAFAHAAVLRDAAILVVVAIVGKLVAAFGASRSKGDRWLIGIGMLPRGEVGLIFATLGLQNHVLGADLYASLLLVVIVTTLITPPLIKLRYSRLRAAAPAPVGGLPLASEPPPGGWLRVVDGRIRLAAMPPNDRVLTVALEAAVEVTDARPSQELLDYISSAAPNASWDDRSSASLRRVVERGNPRSWHFLEAVGVLDRALPEVAETVRARYGDPLMLDAQRTHRWGTLERIRSLSDDDPLRSQYDRLAHPEWLLLAALLVEGLEGRPSPAADAGDIARRVGYGPRGEREIASLVADDGRLRAAAARPEAFDEEEVLQLASHLDSPEQARATYVLAMLREDDLDIAERERLTALHELIQRSLADPTLTGVDARNLIERRRTEAMLLARAEPRVVERIRSAPRAYLARQTPEVIVRHAALIERPLGTTSVRIAVDASENGKWWVDVGARNRPGLMARVTGVLETAGLDVERAVVATWDDDAAVESFLVTSATEPEQEKLAAGIELAAGELLQADPVAGAIVRFDDIASPWHTICEIQTPDFPGLLHDLSSVFAAAGVEIKAATIGRCGALAEDRFEVTGRDGPRLNKEERALVEEYLRSGIVARQRRFRRGFSVSAGT
jgi:Kef-type K+ transport system membrane component KefB